jgi:hypothetical protein
MEKNLQSEKFTAGVVETSGKFATGVIDTVGAPSLTCKYLRNFLKKFEITLLLF